MLKTASGLTARLRLCRFRRLWISTRCLHIEVRSREEKFKVRFETRGTWMDSSSNPFFARPFNESINVTSRSNRTSKLFPLLLELRKNAPSLERNLKGCSKVIDISSRVNVCFFFFSRCNIVINIEASSTTYDNIISRNRSMFSPLKASNVINDNYLTSFLTSGSIKVHLAVSRSRSTFSPLEASDYNKRWSLDIVPSPIKEHSGGISRYSTSRKHLIQ